MTVMEAIKKRESIRGYTDKEIPEAVLREILEAGRRAPTANNTQRVKTVVVRDKALIKALVPACYHQQFVGTAPVVLAVCADQAADMECGQPARVVDASIALSFMMLEATSQGLGTCWLGMYHEEEVRRILSVPAEYEIIAMTPLGYPAVPGPSRGRNPLEDFVVWDRF